MVAKREVPFAGRCSFARDSLSVAIDGARLSLGRLTGAAGEGEDAITWDLAYEGRRGAPPAAPRGPLRRPPLAEGEGAGRRADGRLQRPPPRRRARGGRLGLGGQPEPQLGDEAHGPVRLGGRSPGFDSHPDSFLEVATARLKVGPFWTPNMTPLVLRHRGEEIALSSLVQSVRADASFDYFTWRFRTETDRLSVEGADLRVRAAISSAWPTGTLPAA